IRTRMEIRHLIFEPEEEGDLPVYHLAINESEKRFSIRSLEPEEAGDGATAGAGAPPDGS
ncbi:MAG: hypothetical protein KDD47_23270, partial [Acidobacteria bacterium]|nr:hypothetical protein [Acidobacteriota bacterium]